MRIALAQLNPTIGDVGGNTGKMRKVVEAARRAGADLVVFPELAVTGYPPRDLLCRRDFLQRVERVLVEEIAPLSREAALVVGAPVRGEKADRDYLYNAALLYAEGKLAGRQDKSLLPNYDVFDESRYFRPAGRRIPVQLGEWSLGLTICEDIWNDKDYWNRQLYEVDPVEELAARGVDLIVNISASPYHYGKAGLRLDMLRSIARKYHRPVIYVNQIGGNDELIFDGTSLAVDAGGNVVCLAGSFEEDLLVLEMGRQKSGATWMKPVGKAAGAGCSTWRENAGGAPGHAGTTDSCGSSPEGVDAGSNAGCTPSSVEAPAAVLPQEDIGYVYRALVLGIADYMRKTGFKKAVIGLSGGIDSSVTAVLAAAALGPENVLGVSMPSRYSSPGSRSDARKLAENLGIAFREIPIEEVFSTFLKVMNRDGSPCGDLAEENIQARIRGNILMFISNREGYLTLTTGNKSEMAVGYCTLYGDMSGGLAVLADVPKVMVYQLARYINREREIIPESVLVKPPSAELRPNQVDQDSLPPYEVLDAILQAYIEEEKPADEIAALGFDPALVREVIRKVDRAEYKRRQAAPGLRVTSKAFGMGRRMPIAWRAG
ncbi:NAD+ synthetase [Desulfofundulus kuznetsovii DSM 6115]|uniref:Glutamine-dependent NAD(+) synthetase n=2 Tax=Desulfofundulus kuznetsovii TaxID=58135 RepID=A0AAU8PKR3_DESK7|nr:NAD+ synthetase [Desulfofundulus kuznetsovii DSM 6115]